MYSKNQDSLKCDNCNLSVIKLHSFPGSDGLVCRHCKKDFQKNGKFTREKIKRDYNAANDIAKKYQKKAGTFTNRILKPKEKKKRQIRRERSRNPIK